MFTLVRRSNFPNVTPPPKHMVLPQTSTMLKFCEFRCADMPKNANKAGGSGKMYNNDKNGKNFKKDLIVRKKVLRLAGLVWLINYNYLIYYPIISLI